MYIFCAGFIYLFIYLFSFESFTYRDTVKLGLTILIAVRGAFAHQDKPLRNHDGVCNERIHIGDAHVCHVVLGFVLSGVAHVIHHSRPEK